jgi:uncharacterized membrane protein YccC
LNLRKIIGDRLMVYVDYRERAVKRLLGKLLGTAAASFAIEIAAVALHAPIMPTVALATTVCLAGILYAGVGLYKDLSP